eukprot:m.166366 g.166366  ORF g.166366 m.166366 type:complete len:532 (-) comp18157_c0_seq1:74-1669(-)
MTCEPACAAREECVNGACVCVDNYTNIGGSCHFDHCFSSSVPVCGINFTCISGIGYHSCLCTSELVTVNGVVECRESSGDSSDGRSESSGLSATQIYSIIGGVGLFLLLVLFVSSRCINSCRKRRKRAKQPDVQWTNDNIEYFWDNAVSSMTNEQRGEVFSTPPDNISSCSFAIAGGSGSAPNSPNRVDSTPYGSAFPRVTTRLQSSRLSALGQGLVSKRMKRYSLSGEDAEVSDGKGFCQSQLGFRKLSHANYDVGDGLEPVYVEPRVKPVYRPAELQDAEGYYIIERDKRNVRNSWLPSDGSDFRHSLISAVSDIGSEQAEIIPVQTLVRKRYTVKGTNVDCQEKLEEIDDTGRYSSTSLEPTYQLALRDSPMHVTSPIDACNAPKIAAGAGALNGFTSPLYEFAVSGSSAVQNNCAEREQGVDFYTGSGVQEIHVVQGAEQSSTSESEHAGITSEQNTSRDVAGIVHSSETAIDDGCDSSSVSHQPEEKSASPCPCLADEQQDTPESHENTGADVNMSALQTRRESKI